MELILITAFIAWTVWPSSLCLARIYCRFDSRWYRGPHTRRRGVAPGLLGSLLVSLLGRAHGYRFCQPVIVWVAECWRIDKSMCCPKLIGC